MKARWGCGTLKPEYTNKTSLTTQAQEPFRTKYYLLTGYFSSPLLREKSLTETLMDSLKVASARWPDFIGGMGFKV